jgi:hypothetical protein
LFFFDFCRRILIIRNKAKGTLMSHFNWEDPFAEAGKEENRPPLLWIPEQKVPPVSLEKIRERQKGLLSALSELQRAAADTLKRVAGEPGGATFLSRLERSVLVEVLFRLPDHPGIVREFGPVKIESHPVTLPASAKPQLSALDSLFPKQRIMDPGTTSDEKVVLHQETSLGLIRRLSLSGGEMTPDRIVVYPEILNFINHWILKIDSPISDLRYIEYDKRVADYRSSSFSEALVAPSSPPKLSLQ